MSRTRSSAIWSTEYLIFEALLCPVPRWSWTMTRCFAENAGRLGFQYAPTPPSPGTSSTGSPFPWDS
jgi:hypothetical protein